MKTLLVNIFGRVQGVGFRYFAQKTALAHQIYGWVKNELDGSVTLKISGDEEQLDVFLKALEVGNGFSKVECISMEDIETSEFEGFHVEY
jgi:acylphosphatase